MSRIRSIVRSVPLAAAGLALAVVTAVGSQGLEPASRDTSIYGHVTRVGWVVRDLEAVVAHWKRLGIADVAAPVTREFPGVMYRGKPTTITARFTVARIGDMIIEWIQPISGRSLFTEYLERRGEGIQHIAYAVPSEERFEQELASFKALGVEVVQSGSWHGQRGTRLFADLDTAPQGGGITIELEVNPAATRRDTATSANRDPFNRVTQYAIVVEDVKQVGAYYERLGFGRMPVDHNVSLDRMYRGKPGTFEMYLGWGRGGSVTFEWIEPIVGPSVYHEFLAEKGEGFHHLGFNVEDMDAAIAQLRAAGLEVTMSGGWDTNGHQGRFAYLDAERVGGVSIELLWNKPQGKTD